MPRAVLENLDALEPVGGLRREQQVIDADAVVLLPGAGLVIPERVFMRRAVSLHVGVAQPEIEQRAIGGAGLGLEQRIACPDARIVAIDVARDDVVIAGDNEALFVLQQSRADARCSASMNASLKLNFSVPIGLPLGA